MVTPTVDILLAAYNGARYLPEQLGSLRRQLHRDIRVLMQDDGSSDGTAAVLRSVIDQDERFHMAAENGRHFGACGNFISLLRQSTADYCCLCDQDDVWAPDHVSALLRDLRLLESELGKDRPLLMLSDASVIDDKGKLLKVSLCMHQGWRREGLPLRRLLVQNNATGCTMMMNAALRKLVAEYAQPDRLFMHDWFIAMTAAAFGGIGFNDMPLTAYRRHGGNVLGASRDGLLRRSVHALSQRDKARHRILLTYDQCYVFRECFGDRLPPEASEDVEGYLHTRNMKKIPRILSVRRGGYTMQSFPARMGQLIFG